MSGGKRTRRQKDDITSHTVAKFVVLLLCAGLFLNQCWRELDKYLQELRSTAVSRELEPGQPMPNVLICRAKPFRSDSINKLNENINCTAYTEHKKRSGSLTLSFYRLLISFNMT